VTGKSDWSASQWQAYIENLPTYDERKAALESVPDAFRKRVEVHLRTVMSIKKYHERARLARK
jgi:hypothetical protein